MNTYEKSDELRKDHLRTLLEVFLLNAFETPPVFFENSSMRWLMRELMLSKMVLPTIELLSDPDYLNQQLLDYLSRRESERGLLARKFSLAASFEDFVRLIKSAKSVHELRQLYAHTMVQVNVFISINVSGNQLSDIA